MRNEDAKILEEVKAAWPIDLRTVGGWSLYRTFEKLLTPVDRPRFIEACGEQDRDAFNRIVDRVSHRRVGA